MDFFENIDGDKLVQALLKKDQQLKDMELFHTNKTSQVEAL